VQKRGQASPDDGASLALMFAQPVVPTESKKRMKSKNSGDTPVAATRGGCDDASRRVHGPSVTAMAEVV
jgi:hypothetical protein